MSFAKGDVVQVVDERNRYHGQVGAVLERCVCPIAFLAHLTTGQQTFSVAIDGSSCFLEKSLRKLGERPAPVNTETPVEETA